jgi:hypothetical protein
MDWLERSSLISQIIVVKIFDHQWGDIYHLGCGESLAVPKSCVEYPNADCLGLSARLLVLLCGVVTCVEAENGDDAQEISCRMYVAVARFLV